uniref:Type VII secretion system protein EssD-like domain-containing protein n=1 Tax=Ditylenchus dipsaci TaxID=166011 RepID=A0A915E9B6_9BILA
MHRDDGLNIRQQEQQSKDVEGECQPQDENQHQKHVEKQTKALAMLDMEASPILLAINKIRTENTERPHNAERVSVLPKYQVDLDDVSRRHYLVWPTGVFPGDDMVHVIGKRLGGPGHAFNIVPLNSKLDISAWEEHEDVIYNHLKLNHSARLLFAFEYDDESERDFSRPILIYYHFDLFDENGKIVDKLMEALSFSLPPAILVHGYTGAKIYLQVINKTDYPPELKCLSDQSRHFSWASISALHKNPCEFYNLRPYYNRTTKRFQTTNGSRQKFLFTWTTTRCQCKNAS